MVGRMALLLPVSHLRAQYFLSLQLFILVPGGPDFHGGWCCHEGRSKSSTDFKLGPPSGHFGVRVPPDLQAQKGISMVAGDPAQEEQRGLPSHHYGLWSSYRSLSH